MPTTRAPHDPFTTSSNAASSLRPRTSQASLRPNAGSASTRTRQAPNLFAPSLLRRPALRTTPRGEEDVVRPLPEPEPEASLLGQAHRSRHAQPRRARHESPEIGRHTRLRPRPHAEDHDMVNRQPDGSYLLGASTLGIAASQARSPVGLHDGDGSPEQLDHYHRDLARRYFTSGTHMGGKLRRAADDEFEREKPELVAGLREQVVQKLEGEKWLYEPVERFPTGCA